MSAKFEVPLFVTKSSLPPFERYAELISQIWDSRALTNMGPMHEKLAAELEKYLKVKNITLFSNGHLALDSAIRSLELKGEVITTPFTFVSTSHAISMNGLTPVFCDIKLSDYTIDEDKLEALITEKTCAIVPVHVYGFPCNVQKIQAIADKYSLPVIYDAAHAFGVEVDGKGIAEYGDISMFSFHATKVFNTIEGGALAYNDGKYKKKLNLMKNFGISGPEDVEMIAFNAKMNEFQAAMGIANLECLDEKIENRRRAFSVYKDRLSRLPGLRLAEPAGNVKWNYSYIPVLVDETAFKKNRDELYHRLTEYNVFARKYFYPLISNTAAYAGVKADVPVARYVAERILCLPVHSDMTEPETKLVCDIIDEIYRCKA